ncbi:hypothetical protein L249_2151 [Ophiocordyceps polyrhachis-furcata BCC 54312]|uniref:Uncharacterized protein n=1 Tax=Ophiocordyceps polyrhachis-furcata BCC 54312 TaxID=1330021 RepID=A0A367LP94_9HYPO|nr:hypothetical protein L249_2151 [Ophiocordyceps polyrhachis-furcata BCC 54312]
MQATVAISRLLLISSQASGSLGGHLLLAGDGGLDADAAEDEGDAEPLHAGKAVAEGDDGEDHGKSSAELRLAVKTESGSELGRNGGDEERPRDEGEDGNAERNRPDNEILVSRISSPEERDVKEHDRQQLTALGQKESNIVDVSKTRVPKRTSKTARHRNDE